MHTRGFFFLLGRVRVVVVPNVFTSNSQWVPNMFLKFSMCCSTCFHQHLTLSPMFCPKFYSCKLYKQHKGGEFNIKILRLSKASLFLLFFVIGQSKMPITNIKNIELWGSLQLILQVTLFDGFIQSLWLHMFSSFRNVYSLDLSIVYGFKWSIYIQVKNYCSIFKNFNAFSKKKKNMKWHTLMCLLMSMLYSKIEIDINNDELLKTI